jgi:hypothetical protein
MKATVGRAGSEGRFKFEGERASSGCTPPAARIVRLSSP